MNDTTNEDRLRRAMAAVLHLRKRNTELEDQQFEPVAIVSMACRFPGDIMTPEQYWDLLATGGDAIGPLPERWAGLDLVDPDADAPGKSYAGNGGFLSGLEDFDAEFFGISPREAQSMEPQQRLILETAWEAIERAGLSSATIGGTRTGVYVGAMRADFDSGRGELDTLDGYHGTGISGSVVSGRLSYVLDLHGPSVTVDTACSSSLVVLHMAAVALRNGECELAIAGGATVMNSPALFVESSRLRAMSPDGRCKSFSAQADGGGWAEGCGVVVLKRLSDAERDGDAVLAVIRGSAVNQDGRSQGLTAPNGPSQQQVIREALAASRLTTADIDAIEAHGTGTPLGDPIEAGALAEVFGPGRSPEQPVHLGSSKSNIGHTQAAAGVASVMKMVLALHHQTLPRTLHCDELSPHVPWETSGLSVLRESRPWPRGDRPRRAGISSFGIGGTNAHLIVEEAPVRDAVAAPAGGVAADAYPLLISGTSPEALSAQAERLAHWFAEHPGAAVGEVAGALARTRTHFPVRAGVLAHDTTQAVRGLTALATGAPDPAVVQETVRELGKVVFVFPGQGSQWRRMGVELLVGSEVFRDAVDRCDEALRPWTGWSVRELLNGADSDELPPFDRIDVLQPALFTMMIGLAELWRSFGLQPAAVVGNSQGEVPAAVVAGALSLADGARVCALRSQALLRECSGRGGMALIEVGPDVAAELTAPYGTALSIAVVNSSSSVVVSGDADAVDRLVAEMADSDVYCRRIASDAAGHSAHMDSVLPGLGAALSGLSPMPAGTPFYSTVTGEPAAGETLDGAYWCRNLRETVRLDLALRRLADDEHTVFVEVSPHPVMGMTLGAAAGEAGVAVGSLRRDHGDLGEMLRSLATLHVHGHPVDWSVLPDSASRELIAGLPTYAFQRRRHWIDLALRSSSGRPVAGTAEATPAPHVTGVRDLLAGLAEDERPARLTEIIATEAAAVLGTTDPIDSQRRLPDLGLDSLMALHLRNRLGRLTGTVLPANLAFVRPTVEAMATYLLDEVMGTLDDTASGPALDRAEGRTVYPATDGQRRLWFLERLEPGTAQYHVALKLRVTRPLDRDAFGAALARVAERHESLRTDLEQRDDRLVQVVHPDHTVSLTFDDVAAADLAARVHLAERAPFDLAGTSLARCLVLTPDTGDQIVCLTLHHAITDGWSLTLLLRELYDTYRGLTTGTAHTPEPVEHQLGDYGVWEDETTRDGGFADAVRHFQDELAGQRRLEFPPGPSDPAEPAGTLYFTLPAELRAEIDTLATDTSVTTYTVLVSAFAALLNRWTGQDDFGVATVWANRQLTGATGLTGFLVNTLPLRCDLSGDPTFGGLLVATSGRVRDLLAHQGVPLTEIVDAVGLPRSGDENPLFRTLFNYGSAALPDLGDGDEAWTLPTTGSAAGNVEGAAKFELGITLAPDGDRLRGELEYQSHVLDRAGAERMVARFEEILRRAVRTPDATVSTLTTLPAAELAWLDEHGGTLDPAGSDPATALDLVLAQVRRTPDAIALVTRDSELTYQEVLDRAARLADRLSALDVGRETLVGIHLPRSADAVVSMLAIWLAGAAYVPLDPEFPAARLEHVITDSGLAVVITTAAGHAAVAGDGRRVLVLDDGDLTSGRAVTDGESPRRAADDLAYVIYTSGSTGKPKGVMIEDGQFANFCQAMDDRVGGGTGDTWLAVTSLSFDISGLELIWTLTRGYRVVIAQGSVADWPAYRAFAPTHLQCTPSLARLLLADADGRALLGSIDRLLVGGEALDRGLAGKLGAACHCEITNMYGPTETTVWSSTWTVDPGAPVALGEAVLNTRLYLLDRAGRRVPRGTLGELCIGGLGVARGYLGRPELTAQRFTDDPFVGVDGARLYRTGDLARFREDGTLEFAGRLDSQVKLRGHRIELGEIESVAAEHPAVTETAAVVREDVPGDPRLCLYWTGHTEATEAELTARLAARLPGYMIPEHLMRLPELPHTPNKKVDRAAILRLAAPGAARTSHVPDATTVEDRIAAVWAAVLGVAAVDHDRGFFDLGASSMTAVQAHARISAELDQEFALSALFRHPTVRQLAAFLRGDAAATITADRSATVGDDVVAVIGLACRLPGAPDVDTFWHNLTEGVESISRFTDEELRDAGVPEDLLLNPDYVRAKGYVPDADHFDASFFDTSPADAEIMDPQHRLFLECAWEALENAGLVPQTFPGRIAVYGGTGYGGYDTGRSDDMAAFYRTMIGNKNDYLATRVAHKLNLRGPAMSVQTACSTGLVAAHLARQSLLSGESDVALVGAASLTFPLKHGYLFQEGLVVSDDGSCRAFDEQGGGTVLSNGAGVLVLRRLSDALAAGDTVYAVVRGSAVNNDGDSKVGFTAPSVQGQARVIAAAQAAAGVEPAGIGYVEAHGTATPMGDPIEIQALQQVFGDRDEPCGLGSVKTNIGHTDATAGVAALIKTVLCLHHRELVPSLNYERPNPEMGLDPERFQVVTEHRPWRSTGPLRAGVSSFGIGGTNAHLVLEQAPPVDDPAPAEGVPMPIVLSGRTTEALRDQAGRWARWLAERPGTAVADVAFTSAQRRRHFGERASILARTTAEAVDALRALTAGQAHSALAQGTARPLGRTVFVFPGQGSQWHAMGRDLLAGDAAFRATATTCDEVFAPMLGWSVLALLRGETDLPLDRIDVAQPALFTMYVSLAAALRSAGVEPEAVVGHSQGELAAAVVAGALSLTDAAHVVAVRSRALAGDAGDGEMGIVQLPVDEVVARLEPYGGAISVAAVNTSSSTVISGAKAAVLDLLMELDDEDIACGRLHAACASHSALMDPLLPELAAAIGDIRPMAGTIPFYSTVTGGELPGTGLDAAYWCRNLQEPVRRDLAQRRLREDGYSVLIEVSPHPVLAAPTPTPTATATATSSSSRPCGGSRAHRRSWVACSASCTPTATRSTGPGYSRGAGCWPCPPTPSSGSGTGSTPYRPVARMRPKAPSGRRSTATSRIGWPTCWKRPSRCATASGSCCRCSPLGVGARTSSARWPAGCTRRPGCPPPPRRRPGWTASGRSWPGRPAGPWATSSPLRSVMPAAGSCRSPRPATATRTPPR